MLVLVEKVALSFMIGAIIVILVHLFRPFLLMYFSDM